MAYEDLVNRVLELDDDRLEEIVARETQELERREDEVRDLPDKARKPTSVH